MATPRIQGHIQRSDPSEETFSRSALRTGSECIFFQSAAATLQMKYVRQLQARMFGTAVGSGKIEQAGFDKNSYSKTRLNSPQFKAVVPRRWLTVTVSP